MRAAGKHGSVGVVERRAFKPVCLSVALTAWASGRRGVVADAADTPQLAQTPSVYLCARPSRRHLRCYWFRLFELRDKPGLDQLGAGHQLALSHNRDRINAALGDQRLRLTDRFGGESQVTVPKSATVMCSTMRGVGGSPSSAISLALRTMVHFKLLADSLGIRFLQSVHGLCWRFELPPT